MTGRSQEGRRRLTNSLAVTAVATHLVIILGATVALTEMGSACPTWPTCNGRLLALGSPEAAVASGYRLVVAAAGLLVLVSTAVAFYDGAERKTKTVLSVALLLYAVEVGMGALIATNSVPMLVPAAHLGVAVVVFVALLVALTWSLESEAESFGIESEVVDGGAREEDATEAEQDVERPSRTEADADTGLVSTARAYIELTKPRLMWLLCLVALAAMGLAAGSSLSLSTVVPTLAGGVLSIGASGTFNNVIERDKDKEMQRTSDRPVVEERVPATNALVFGVALSVASVVVFAIFVNYLAAVLGLIAILFYSVVYTVVLKPNTDQNIVIGGAVGALPALIGWAAVTNSIGVPALVLGGVIFVWTPAHFYNLALAYKDDYERGGFPMLPVVRGERVTMRHILFYLGATLVAASVLGAVSSLGWLYALTSTLVGGVFVVAVVALYRQRTDTAALRAFHASNAYLGCLLLAVVVDSLLV